MNNTTALVIGDGSIWGEVAHHFAEAVGFETEYFAWRHDEAPVPEGLGDWQGDWIFCFKADYILSSKELSRARLGVLNFHPGPPSLRGVGTYHVALDEGRSQYGVTCHHVTTGVDAGPIIATDYFDIAPGMTPLILQETAAAHLYLLYTKTLRLIQSGRPLPVSTEQWSGPLHTWKQLERRRKVVAA